METHFVVNNVNFMFKFKNKFFYETQVRFQFKVSFNERNILVHAPRIEGM